ncbi:MAG TPA: TorF family putative porin, partial [Rhodocyclaceae bacterium]|nr:TorF family putative porin [Rhodocyclaceae bacterium]
MHKTLIASLIAAAFLVPAVASAQTAPVPSPFTGNVMLTSEYLYRGIAQSNGKPAIQGGFDYVNPNGLYVGTWGSSIS